MSDHKFRVALLVGLISAFVVIVGTWADLATDPALWLQRLARTIVFLWILVLWRFSRWVALPEIIDQVAIAARRVLTSAQRASRLRRERLRAAPGRCTPKAKAQRWAVYGNLCWVCGTTAKQTDHVIAVASGGSNWPANMRPICASCNGRKGARDWRSVRACGLPKPGRLP